MSAWFRGYWQNSFFDDYQKLDEDTPQISIQESKRSLQGQVEHRWSNCQTQIPLDLRSLKDREYNIIYIDEFNISSTSIKTYNWSVRGCQDYWFADKKSNKLNCIIAVSADGPVDIFIQEDSIKAENFSSFVEGIVQKLRSSENDADSETVLVYDNASIHISKLVQKTIDRIRWAVVTLPPYTPEWNDSEVVINIIKRKLDSDIKQNKKVTNNDKQHRVLTQRIVKREFFGVTRKQLAGINQVWFKNMWRFVDEIINN